MKTKVACKEIKYRGFIFEVVSNGETSTKVVRPKSVLDIRLRRLLATLSIRWTSLRGKATCASGDTYDRAFGEKFAVFRCYVQILGVIKAALVDEHDRCCSFQIDARACWDKEYEKKYPKKEKV